LPVPGEKLLDAGWMLAGWMLDAGWMLAGWLDGFSFWQL
jgi:hypothetical protein